METTALKKVFHPANSRGLANHGWLKSRHTFSFAGYHDPTRERFGLLRVLNDDEVAAGNGFGTHPHDNMEIVSIPLRGALEHRDSTGRHEIIRTGDVQIMSAGSGIRHSEQNASAAEPVHFLQIWVFPKERNIQPRYEQKTFAAEGRQNRLQTVVAPQTDADGPVWINQDAWFSLGDLEAGATVTYSLHQPGNGLYLLVLEGAVAAADTTLGRRDAIGVWETDELTIQATTPAQVLLIEVPMY